MELNFFESNDIPQPRDQIKIEKLKAAPYPDGWRVRVGVDVTPFQERPSLEINLFTAQGKNVAQLSVIETMHRSMEFTIHIRGVQSQIGDYILRAELYYDERTHVQHQMETPFSISN